MKILHVLPSISPKSGGPAKAVVDFANLCAENNEITIACTNEDFGKADPDIIAKQIGLSSKVTLKLFSFKGTHSSKFSVFLLRWFKHELIHFHVVHIHAAFSVMSSLAAKECRRQAIPYIFRPLGTLSNYSLNSGNTQFKSWYWRYIEKKTCQSAKCIHVTSDKEAEEIKALGVTTFVKVSPLPVSVTERSSSGKKSPLRFGVMTRLHPKKNLEMIILSAAQLAEKYDFTLEIAGSGEQEYEQKLKKLVDDKSLNEKVIFSGFLEGDSKEEFWNRTDYFVLPSFHENFGRVVAESLARSIPVLISTEIDIAPKVLEYDCGFVCNTNLESVLEKMEDCLEVEDSKYALQSENAKKCVAKEFIPEQVKADLQEMYTMEA